MSTYNEDRILTQAISPCGQTIATLSANEQLSLWDLFEKRRVDLQSESGDLFVGFDDRATRTN